MLENHVASAITRRRLRSGPVADQIDDFADWLFASGYKPHIIVRSLRSLARRTEWLTETGKSHAMLKVHELNSTRIVSARPQSPIRVTAQQKVDDSCKNLCPLSQGLWSAPSHPHCWRTCSPSGILHLNARAAWSDGGHADHIPSDIEGDSYV
jgi:hypothetical protein